MKRFEQNKTVTKTVTKSVIHISILLLMIMTLTSCGTSLRVDLGAKTATVEPNKQFIETEDRSTTIESSAINKMGWTYLKAISETETEKNILFSPVGLSTVLAMLENGAEGETKKGILKAMNEDENSDDDAINDHYNALVNSLNRSTDSEVPSATIKLANSIWVKTTIKLKQEFVDAINAYFKGEVFRADFSNKKTVDKMNQWIDEATNNLLKGTIDQIPVEASIYLINTLYFKGTWVNEFSENMTEKKSFAMGSGTTEQVDMMSMTDHFNYYEDDRCQITRLPYYGNCSFVLILPKEGIEDFLVQTDDKTLKELIDKMKENSARLDLSLPKFDLSTQNSLNSFLEQSGMNLAFSPKEAQFKRMAEIDGENLYLSTVFQNARIKLDEKGTEAAAVTVAVETTSAVMPSETIVFNCDRPFIYFIQDDKNGTNLFVGIVRDPIEK